MSAAQRHSQKIVVAVRYPDTTSGCPSRPYSGANTSGMSRRVSSCCPVSTAPLRLDRFTPSCVSSGSRCGRGRALVGGQQSLNQTFQARVRLWPLRPLQGHSALGINVFPDTQLNCLDFDVSEPASPVLRLVEPHARCLAPWYHRQLLLVQQLLGGGIVEAKPEVPKSGQKKGNSATRSVKGEEVSSLSVDDARAEADAAP